jgi:hypothetical protein
MITYSGTSKTWNKVSEIYVFLSEIDLHEPVADKYATPYKADFEYRPTLLFRDTSVCFSFASEHQCSTYTISQHVWSNTVTWRQGYTDRLLR